MIPLPTTKIYARALLSSTLEKHVYQGYEEGLSSLRFMICFTVDDKEAKRILETCHAIPAVLDATWLYGTVILKVYLKH